MKRVYELAKEFDLSSREVIAVLASLGVVAKSHSSTVDWPVVEKIEEAARSGTLKQLAAAAPTLRAQRPARPSRTAERPAAERPAAARPAVERPAAATPSPAPAARPAAKAAPPAAPAPKRKAPGRAAAPAPASTPAAPPQSQEPAPPPKLAEPAVRKPLTVQRGVTVQEFAQKIAVASSDVIKKLFLLGEMYTLAKSLTDEAAELVANEYGYELKLVSPGEELEEILADEEQEDESLLSARPPVITVMGHVDHGKTLLLDRIRQTDVVASEHGGITQHIGAYQVHKNDRAITFIDTPGHEAFTQMRARGAKVTDIVVLVVAADDGVKPQTIEALNHAKAAEVPIVVAVNKIDKPEANTERVRQQLSEHELVPEEWGGETPYVNVSAKAGTNIEDLLDVLLLVADIGELKANEKAMPRGIVIEAHLDKGRGPVATVLVQRGTLRAGDIIVCGATFAKVRAMFDDLGKPLKEAGPASPAQVLGFNAVPSAGDDFRGVDDERTARQIAQARESRKRVVEKISGRRRVTLDDIYEQAVEGETIELNIILKADVQGSLEAINDALMKMQIEDATVRVIHRAVGAITQQDVTLAEASGAILIGFNVRPEPKARSQAEEAGVDIRTYQIIYKLVEDIEGALKGLLKPVFTEVVLGRAEVREVFKGSRIGTIAGCYVEEGTITRGAKARLYREGVLVIDSTISSLRRFKDDVREVQSGYECGIGIENYSDVKARDSIEAYEVREIPRD